MTKIVLGFYDDAGQAQQSAQALRKIGINQSEIGVCGGENQQHGSGGLLKSSEPGALIAELHGFGIPQEEAELYAKGLQHGGGFLIAKVGDEKAEEAASVLNRGPVADINSRAKQWRSSEHQGEQRSQQGGSQEGQTLQAVEEELQVGKRETAAGGVRVRSYVEEKPVEEHVRLREEEVSVDRQKKDKILNPQEADKAFEERTVEVKATREQPVVSKQARVVEEVTVGKTQHEREEVVRGTVRSTKLEVEQDEGVKQNS